MSTGTTNSRNSANFFCEICQLCKPISQKRTGQDSRNSLTGLTLSQGVIMQRTRVSQGKLNEYRHHETVGTQPIFCEICQLCKSISQKRTRQDSRNSPHWINLESRCDSCKEPWCRKENSMSSGTTNNRNSAIFFVKFSNFVSRFLKNAQDRIHVTLPLD